MCTHKIYDLRLVANDAQFVLVDIVLFYKHEPKIWRV